MSGKHQENVKKKNPEKQGIIISKEKQQEFFIDEQIVISENILSLNKTLNNQSSYYGGVLFRTFQSCFNKIFLISPPLPQLAEKKPTGVVIFY